MKRKTDFKKDALIWMSFAAYDLKTAKWNLKGEIYTSVCYSSQQTAEKSLKALFFYFGKNPPRVHSLDYLISELKKTKINISLIEQSALVLDKYYISSRYPGQYGGPEGMFNREEAEEALQAAQMVLIFTQKIITE